MTTAVQSVWLTTDEAATAARRHVRTVQSALLVAELHGHQRRPHGQWIVHPAAVDAWVAGLSPRVQAARCACGGAS